MQKLTLALLLFLAGCSSTPSVPPPVVEAKPVVYHPALPTPLYPCVANWKVLVVDNQPYVALTYQDNINLAICGVKVEAYIDELMEVACHYRDGSDIQCKGRNGSTTIISNQ